jgi:peroxiredoxin
VPRRDSLFELPPGIPVPVDDGACQQLPGTQLPAISLESTQGRWVDLSEVSGLTAVFCYPRTGLPNEDPPPGWNQIPGARGCTLQVCAFRDEYAALRTLGVDVFGLSTQEAEYQREMVRRLEVPFEILSDADLRLTRALQLPTLTVGDMTLVKRLTMIVQWGVVQHVFYPIFPPFANAGDVLTWVGSRDTQSAGGIRHSSHKQDRPRRVTD